MVAPKILAELLDEEGEVRRREKREREMARIEKERVDTSSNLEKAWGTLEELLLACAVSRHGTKSWESIAKEIQKRASKNRNNQSNGNNFLNVFTPQNCKQKYRDLKRRFNVNRGSGVDTVVDGDGEGGSRDEDSEEGVRGEMLCMVDELRRLRVEELKREVHRHDISIASLKLKVKRLEEERERSLTAEAEGAADLLTKHGSGTRTGEKQGEPERSPPGNPTGEAASTGGSGGPEDRSSNESNSSNQKRKNRKAAVEERESKHEPEETKKEESDRVGTEPKPEPSKDCSYSGGSGSIKGDMVVDLSPLTRPGDSHQLRDSVSESTKQSSDVQSSASLYRRKRRHWWGSVGCGSGGDEPAERLSPVDKGINLKPQPLIRFIHILRSHGSAFKCGLPVQETEKYRNLIRQHMDLDTVQSRLDKGTYTNCHMKFYRDLLLIFTNAIVFYHKSSAEHLEARELRKLVTQEISERIREQTLMSFKPDPERQLLEPAVKKLRTSTTMIMCRLRSSTSVTPSSESLNGMEEGRMKNGRVVKAKPDHNSKAVNNDNGYLNKGDEKGVPKKLRRERSALGNRSLATSNKKEIVTRDIDDREGSDTDEQLGSKKGSHEKMMPATKKQGVANFLKRMKQDSPPREGMTQNGNRSEKERREKTRVDTKRGNRKDNRGGHVGYKRGTSGRRERETEKRAVGRRSRRKAAMSMVKRVAGKRKRGRFGSKPDIFCDSFVCGALGLMGRVRGKGKKLAAYHEDPRNGKEETIPAQKRKGRPEKPLKDEIGEEFAEKLEEDDLENKSTGPSSKDMNNAVAGESGKKRKRNSPVREKPSPVKDETKFSNDISAKSIGFRHIGSRRKSKPRRAAEVGVDCK
ncbi:hypothetical protein Nepgr_012130 [Nepenthes gracilis]|uniref:Bromo domain-containing protein n=1 Tax=Nepenthes gracilis TaxID=150966 RepID=A0AAD3XMW0_NEPGR|nr:hypothetical protein Nepgr_012130 [Nepenthes gracilis]